MPLLVEIEGRAWKNLKANGQRQALASQSRQGSRKKNWFQGGVGIDNSLLNPAVLRAFGKASNMKRGDSRPEEGSGWYWNEHEPRWM
jgi:hypothetical protein